MVAAVIRRVRMAPKGCATTDNGPHVSCACSGWLGWRQDGPARRRAFGPT